MHTGWGQRRGEQVFRIFAVHVSLGMLSMADLENLIGSAGAQGLGHRGGEGHEGQGAVTTQGFLCGEQRIDSACVYALDAGQIDDHPTFASGDRGEEAAAEPLRVRGVDMFGADVKHVEVE